ncbi:ferredoxin-thioredoxin reductase catalytic domain-containing protein [Methanobacterium sp. MBAC-LM]|uniref:ferredoxin-thioredoxin reductase catalytic domain-containing protein n=1 Tax=Methanobacterium sp. MBAC-LM TaxID=3412034 RepID=UPI003C78602D
MSNISDAELDHFYEKVKKDAESSGYHLNPNVEFTKELLEGILTNEKRYGYGSCPCRLAAGDKEIDIDVICPCDYRDPDLNDYDTCYCGLYVSGDILEGTKEVPAIPERRPTLEEREQSQKETLSGAPSSFQFPVWRCSVCGYLCAREEPPEVCPICKVEKERFKKFL